MGRCRTCFWTIAKVCMQPGSDNKRILLVDDEESVRLAIRLVLELDGHKVIDVSTGREALKALAGERFDLVITDYGMPNLRGDELARKIKKSAPRQRILMVSGRSPSLGSLGSVDALISKPFAIRELRQIVAKLISNK